MMAGHANDITDQEANDIFITAALCLRASNKLLQASSPDATPEDNLAAYHAIADLPSHIEASIKLFQRLLDLTPNRDDD
jgi:hypothetical protein